MIEVIVALAITTMIVAATTSSVLVSARTGENAHFHQQARSAAAFLLFNKIHPSGREDQGTNFTAGLSMEQEEISPGKQEFDPGWMVYRIRSAQGNRMVQMALAAE